MSTSHTVCALTKKHAELQGFIEDVEKQLAELNHKLRAVETSIKLFDPEFKMNSIKLKRTYGKPVPLERGVLPRLVGDYVRLSDENFMISDVVNYVMDLHCDILNESHIKPVKTGISQCLNRLANRKTITEVGRDNSAGSAIIWRSQH